MLSGGDCREVPSSSAFYTTQNYVRTASPTEACPVPWSQGQQTLLSKTHFYMDCSFKEGNCRRNLSQRPNYSVHVGDPILQKNPLLLQLLMTDHDNNNSNDTFLLSQKSKTTPRPTTETSFNPTVSNTKANENKNLDDGQILKLIEEKLTYFRAQMKAQRSDSSSKDSSTAEQHPTPGTSVPRALDDNISKDHRENKASGGSIHSPEMPAECVRIWQEAEAVISQKEAEDRHVVLPALGSVATVKDLVKHRPTLTLHPKLFNEKCNSVWRNDQFLNSDKERDLHSVKNKMEAADDVPGEDFSKLNQGTLTSLALETAERDRCYTEKSRQKIPQTSYSEDVKMHLSQTSNPKTDFANIPSRSGEHMKVCKQQLTEGTQEKKVETGEHKMERGLFDRMFEILKNPVFDDISDDEGDNRTQPIFAPSLSLQNKDIHENLTVQLSRQLANATPAENVNTNSMTSQFQQVSSQLENNGMGEGAIPENGTIQVEISRPPKQNLLKRTSCSKSNTEHPEACSPNWKLQCSCPFFVEIEDGFEQRPCPKCALDCSSLNWKEDSSPKQEEDPLPKQGVDTLLNQQHFSQTLDSRSEDCLDTDLASDSQYKTVIDPPYEEDEWFVVNLTISDVKLDQEIIVLDDTDDDGEESGHPLNQEPLKQPIQSCFQKLPEFDSLPIFIKSKSLEYNLEVPLEVSNTALSVQLPLASISLPKLEAVEKSASEPTSVTSEAEDSCDTDDSSDYPLQTKRNYLTASSRVKAPSPLRHVSESVEEGEVVQALGTVSPGSPPASASSNIFSRIISSDDEDSSTANDPTIASTMSKMLCKDASKTKAGKKRSKSKTLKKAPRIVSEDDDDDPDEELNQNRKLKRRRSDTSETRKVSSPPKRPALRTRSVRFEQNDQVSSSVSSKGSCQVNQRQAAKRKRSSENSSSDHIRKVRRSSPEAAESMVQEMSEKQPKTNASNTNLRRQLSQPSAPTKAKDVRGSPLTKFLSLNGDEYHASSLPGHKRGQPEPQNSSPPKPNQVNSYCTAKSTEAKKKLVNEWEQGHVPAPPKMRKRRRTTSSEQGASSHNNVVNMPNRRDLEHSAQRKRNPPRTVLMKKTVSEAVQLTQHMHRQATTKQNPDKTFSGYKWKKPHTNDLDWDWEKERDGCSPEHPKGLAEY